MTPTNPRTLALLDRLAALREDARLRLDWADRAVRQSERLIHAGRLHLTDRPVRPDPP